MANKTWPPKENAIKAVKAILHFTCPFSWYSSQRMMVSAIKELAARKFNKLYNPNTPMNPLCMANNVEYSCAPIFATQYNALKKAARKYITEIIWQI